MKKKKSRLRSVTGPDGNDVVPAVDLPTLEAVCPYDRRPSCIACGLALEPWWIVAYGVGTGLERPPTLEEVAAGPSFVHGHGTYDPALVYARSRPYQDAHGLMAYWEGWNGLYLGYGGEDHNSKPPPFCSEACAARYGVAAYRTAERRAAPVEEAACSA